MQNFASIPTTYNRIVFRSRLEARWAALFDMLRWEWEYEPYDLNGWIPDFLIKGELDLLVEVKPFPVCTSYPEIDSRWVVELEKISKASPDLEVLLLSNSPLATNNESNSSTGCFGFITHIFEKKWFYEDVQNALVLAEQVLVIDWLGEKFFLAHEPLIAAYEVTYTAKGRAGVNFDNNQTEKYLVDMWKQAGNITQWNKKK